MPEVLGWYDITSVGLRLLNARIMATIPMISTAAPPMAMPAMAPGLRAGPDDDLAELLLFALADAIEVGEIVVGVKAVGVAVTVWSDGAADAIPSAVRLT